MSDLAALAERGAPKPPAGLVIARYRDGALELASAGPVAPDAVFELGSIAKAVTGLLLADAVVRLEVALETPLAECLADARPPARITLGALASHTAGLPRLPLALLRRRGFLNLTDPYAGTTVQELLDDLARIRIRKPRLRYSNFGAALLGQALAARAGASYEELVEKRVLRPLGVEEVWARDARRSRSRITAAADPSLRGRSMDTPRPAACAAPRAARWRFRSAACSRRRPWPRQSRSR